MHQLVFIHGGDTFRSYDEYLDALKSWTYEPTSTQERWKNTLAPSLGEAWEVLMPSMPSKANAKYEEWKIWFEKVVPYLCDGAVLVGHSLGGVFLAKYLDENTLPISVRATFLVAAPYDFEEEEYLEYFKITGSLQKFKRQGGQIFLYHSEDDPVVPISELNKYRAQLPDATVRTFTDQGHFLGVTFPEIVEDIKAVAR